MQAFGNLGGFEFLERNGIIDATPEGFGEYFANAATASVIGGTASVIGGGKFANGAMTGAFSRLCNDLVHAAGNSAKFREQQYPAAIDQIRRAGLGWIIDDLEASPLTFTIYEAQSLQDNYF